MYIITPFLRNGRTVELTAADYASKRRITYFEAKAELKRMVDARCLRRVRLGDRTLFCLRVPK